ncbi:MAG: hypothetical protein WBW16_09295 [Bacteroidota bacterium]
MKSITVPLWLFILQTLVTLAVGSGAVWSWKNSQVENARLEIEVRTKMMDQLGTIITYWKDPTLREQNRPEYQARIDNYNALERILAGLEGRQAIVYRAEELLPSPPVLISPPNGAVVGLEAR